MFEVDVKNVMEGREGEGRGGGPAQVSGSDSKCVVWWFLLNKMDKKDFFGQIKFS